MLLKSLEDLFDCKAKNFLLAVVVDDVLLACMKQCCNHSEKNKSGSKWTVEVWLKVD